MNDSSSDAVKPAFVALATEQEVKKHLPPGAKSPYDFGFQPAMARLLLAHDTLGPTFRAHFANVMFKPGALSRPEREMVAAIAAAAQDCFY